jgi:hypothetical protein
MKQEKEPRNKRLACLERPLGILERNLALPRRELIQVRNRRFSPKIRKCATFTTLFTLDLPIFYLWLHFAFFQSLKVFFVRSPRPSSPFSAGIMRRKPPYLEGFLRTRDRVGEDKQEIDKGSQETESRLQVISSGELRFGEKGVWAGCGPQEMLGGK